MGAAVGASAGASVSAALVVPHSWYSGIPVSLRVACETGPALGAWLT